MNRTPNKYYVYGSQFNTFEFPVVNLFGNSQAKLSELLKTHLQFLADKVPRTYLFLGAPGTGKTSFAAELAKNGNKIIKFDCRGLENITIDSVSFLLSGLEPDYILIDDIDRIFSNHNPIVLHTLDYIKQYHPSTTVVLTANQADKMDPAVLRPGRIDQIIEFGLPDEEERGKILTEYSKLFDISIIDNDLQKLIAATESLAGAHLREAVIQCKYSNIQTIVDNLEKTKNLLNT